MATAPKDSKAKIDQATNAWETLAIDKVFGGMTLAQFKTLVKPSQDTRDAIKALDDQMMAAINAREDADAASLAKVQLVINGVLGDPAFGPDSALYEAMGYVRKSERKSGLTRKGKTA
jgi:hypothetical protein